MYSATAPPPHSAGPFWLISWPLMYVAAAMLYASSSGGSGSTSTVIVMPSVSNPPPLLAVTVYTCRGAWARVTISRSLALITPNLFRRTAWPAATEGVPRIFPVSVAMPSPSGRGGSTANRVAVPPLT